MFYDEMDLSSQIKIIYNKNDRPVIRLKFGCKSLTFPTVLVFGICYRCFSIFKEEDLYHKDTACN